MSGASESREPLEVLAEEFLDRIRRGESPLVDEYARAHPLLAAQIRDLFPTLLAMEELGPRSSDPGEPNPVHHPPVSRLGEYRVLREIGRGGMGVVYEAEQETLGRRVALKVLSRQTFPDEVHLERFRQEARAAARLHHTNIVPVFGVGDHEGVHYYAMQYIHGQTLADVLTEVRRLRASDARQPAAGGRDEPGAPSAADVALGLVTGVTARQPASSATATEAAEPERRPAPALDRRPPETTDSGSGRLLVAGDGSESDALEMRGTYYHSVARVGRQVAEALAYAHGEGVLHRDIKPSNLLLDLRGTVWITDFGLAKADESSDLTASGNVVGTLRYMAPERFRGDADERSDVYSLGITIYELLALRPAFEGSDRVRLVHDVTTREPPSPRRIDPAIPRDLETIVMKAMAKSPRDRYASARELAEDLRRFLGFEPIGARRSTAPERLWRWCQRNPTVASLSGTIAALTVALALGGALTAVQFRKERDTAFERLVESKIEEGRAWRRSGRLGQRLRSRSALVEAARARPTPEIRDELLGALSLRDLEVIEELDLPPGGVRTSDDLKLWATRGPDQSIRVYNAPSMRERVATFRAPAAELRGYVFSPSGRLAAVRYGGAGASLTVWDVQREKAVLELSKPGPGLAVAFTLDDSLMAVCAPGGGIDIRLVPDGDIVGHLASRKTVHALAFDPAGTRLAVVGIGAGEHVVEIHEVASEKVVARLHHPERVTDVAWHPEGGLLATACFDFRVHLWRVGEWRRLRALEGHSAEVTRVGFSRDGALLASASWDSRTILWDPRAGTRLLSAPGAFTGISPDGRIIALKQGSHRFGRWRIVGGSEYRQLRVPTPSPREKQPRTMVFSPDGRWLAAVCGHYGVRVWSTLQPQISAQLEIGWTDDAAFTADGSALLTTDQLELTRWPITLDADQDTVTLGPPRPLGIGGWRFALDGAGRTLAVIRDEAGFDIHHLDRPGEPPLELDHRWVHGLDVSESGRWVVSVTWQGSEIRVWDAARGEREATFAGTSANARFSPDERWLTVAEGTRFTMYETGTWRPHVRFDRRGAGDRPGSVAYTGDSRFMAIGRTLGHLEIISIDTGETVARLEPPDASQITSIQLSRAGDFVAAAAPGRGAVHLWNLRAMREELAALDLDWTPRLRRAPPAARSASRIRIDYGENREGYRGQTLPAQERGKRLMTIYSDLIEIDPSAENYLRRAEVHEEMGQLTAALADLDSALALSPEDEAMRERRMKVLTALETRD